MQLSNTKLLLIAILVLAVLFVLGNCKLECSKKEGWTDQVRDHVSNPYFTDIFSNCEKSLATARMIPCDYSQGMLGGWDRSEPLTARAQKLIYAEQAQQDAEAAQTLMQAGAM